MKLVARLFAATCAVTAAATVNATAVGTLDGDPDELCSTKVVENHGCSIFCGFEGITAMSSQTHLCLPSSRSEFNVAEMPFFAGSNLVDDRQEFCELVARDHGCCHVCGYRWSPVANECRHVSEITSLFEQQPQSGQCSYPFLLCCTLSQFVSSWTSCCVWQ